MALYRIEELEVLKRVNTFEVEANSAVMARDQVLTGKVEPYDEDTDTFSVTLISTERVDTGDELAELRDLVDELADKAKYDLEACLALARALARHIADHNINIRMGL